MNTTTPTPQLVILTKEQEDKLAEAQFDALEHEFYLRFVECFIGIREDEEGYQAKLEACLPFFESQDLQFPECLDSLLRGRMIIIRSPEPGRVQVIVRKTQ